MKRFLGAMVLVTCGVICGQGQVYDFETLSVNTFIAGSDGWHRHPSLGLATVSEENGSLVVRHHKRVSSEPNYPASLTRIHSDSFGVATYPAVARQAALQFDVNGESRSLFALGRDVDGDGLVTPAPGERGPAFGMYDGSFRVMAANDGTATDAALGSGNSGNDWYRLRLAIDFTAHAGEGGGSLFYRNLTDGDAVFIPVTELQNVPLGLSSMSPQAQPDRWNAMWLMLLTLGGSNVPAADNLVPRALPAVTALEPVAGGQLRVEWAWGDGPLRLWSRTSVEGGDWSPVPDTAYLPEPGEALLPALPGAGSGFFRLAP